MDPLFEGEKLAGIGGALGGVQSLLYCSQIDVAYTEVLDFAVQVKDADARDRLVMVARELRALRRRQAEAYETLGFLRQQLEAVVKVLLENQQSPRPAERSVAKCPHGADPQRCEPCATGMEEGGIDQNGESIE